MTTAPDQESAHLEYTQVRARLDNEIRMVNERDEEIATLRAEVAHLRAALNRMRDLGYGMSRSWYVREIEDGLTYPPND